MEDLIKLINKTYNTFYSKTAKLNILDNLILN